MEARTPLASGSTAPFDGDLAGTTLTLAGGARAHLHARYTGSGRLWVATSGATDHSTDGVYVIARAGAKP